MDNLSLADEGNSITTKSYEAVAAIQKILASEDSQCKLSSLLIKCDWKNKFDPYLGKLKPWINDTLPLLDIEHRIQVITPNGEKPGNDIVQWNEDRFFSPVFKKSDADAQALLRQEAIIKMKNFVNGVLSTESGLVLDILHSLMEWEARYEDTLGELNPFVCSIPEFEVNRADLDGKLYVSSHSVDTGDARSPILTEESERVGREALANIQKLLQRELTSVPPYSMKMSLLAVQCKWTSFRDSFGDVKMKDWIRNLPNSNVKVYDRLGPGFDYASLTFDTYESVHIPLEQQSQSLVSEPLGISVVDYFHVPNGPDLTEQSYKRECLRTTELIAYFVQKRKLVECLNYGADRFKICEWRGDAVLHLEITNMQYNSQVDLFGTGGLQSRRSNAEQRLTLALLFDEMKVARFMKICPLSWSIESYKAKCDIVEAIIGELYSRLNDASENSMPFGHEDREKAFYLIRRLAQSAYERGSKLKSVDERKNLTAAAMIPGGGGILNTEADNAATQRCSASTVTRVDLRI